jgi:hypothetical protein
MSGKMRVNPHLSSIVYNPPHLPPGSAARSGPIIHYEPFYMAHEEDEFCWCEPILIHLDDETGDAYYCHRDLN